MKLHSLRARVSLAGGIIVVLAVLEIYAIVSLTDRVSTLATVERLTTLERGRSQNIAKDVLILARGDDATVRADLTMISANFDRTLSALVNGGAAPLPATGNVAAASSETVQVQAVAGTIAGQLATVQQQWLPFQAAVQAILGGTLGSPEANAAVDTIVKTNQSFLDSLAQAADTASADLTAALDLLRLVTVAGAIVIGVFMLGAATWVSRSVVRPIETLASATRQVAGGDLSAAVRSDGRSDEVGALAGAFTDMTASLRGNLQSQRETVGNLTSASSEILAAVNQLTAGATEESAAVAEIMTTVEEVRVTAEQAAERAKAVAEAAGRTSEAASQGQAAVGAARDGIGDVASKVDVIAQRILALSEQTQAIGEIVAAVTDLTDQSNLLAVNAAIEAAKAGEHGRGFAVVAQEVRHLADQSREATGQISGILGEIQKAANAAVLVTEQGTKGAGEAVERMEQAGMAIDQLAGAITEAVAAARQIAASANQQRVGVDQIAAGVNNIGQVSTQTVAAARQLQREAEGLTKLADHLQGLTERFRLEGERGAARELVG